MIGHEDAGEAIDTLPSFKNWPPTISDLLEEADSVRYLLDSDRTELPHSDRIDPREAGVLIDLVRHGVRCLVQTMVTLDAIATWNPQPGLVVWPNPLTCRERVDQRLAPDQWHATLSPLANVVIARKALWNEEAAMLRRIAEAMAQQLGAAAKELDTVVRDRWDAPATRVAEHVLASFRHMERAEHPGPAPLAPIAPWSEDWWIIVPGGPASTQTIRDYAQRQKHELELALKQLTRSRSTTLHAATTAPMLALGAAGIDAIRRLRVFQHVLLFVIERTIEEWPIITPVPIDEGIPWAIRGERLPLLEEQRAVLAATTPTPATMLTFLTQVAATLDETLLDLRYVEQMELGNQIEGMSDVDDALARLIHGAAAPPRPAMPWLEQVEEVRAMRRTLRTQAVQVRDAILHGRIARPKRRRHDDWDRQPTKEGQACIDAIRKAVAINRHLIFRTAVLRQVAQRVQAGEEPTPESLRPRWIGRVWWAWNERSADYVFRDAIHEAYQPLDIRIFYGSGDLQCGLASVYSQMASVLSDSIRDASRIDDWLWTRGIDPRPWAAAAKSVYDQVDAADPHTKATVCCDCGKVLGEVMESYQCRACDEREW